MVFWITLASVPSNLFTWFISMESQILALSSIDSIKRTIRRNHICNFDTFFEWFVNVKNALWVICSALHFSPWLLLFLLRTICETLQTFYRVDWTQHKTNNYKMAAPHTQRQRRKFVKIHTKFARLLCVRCLTEFLVFGTAKMLWNCRSIERNRVNKSARAPELLEYFCCAVRVSAEYRVIYIVILASLLHFSVKWRFSLLLQRSASAGTLSE